MECMERIDYCEGFIPKVCMFATIGEDGRYEKPIPLDIKKIRYNGTISGVEYVSIVTFERCEHDGR